MWTSHLKAILHDSDQRLETDAGKNEQRGKDAERLDPELVKEYLRKEPRSPFCRLLDGSVAHAARRSVQASFNRRETGPYILVAQSLVGREGINLHKECRRVFLFHPEWNPAVMEQQIGRVDRIESYWTRLAKEWKAAGKDVADFPRIEVESLVFRGTYDEYQATILSSRRASLNAQLFGVLLDEEKLEKVPDGYSKKLAEAAPDWEPGRTRSGKSSRV